MPAIDSAWDLITSQEGFRASVYDDATGFPIVPGSRVSGHPTIGIGRALDVRGITRTEAEFLFQNDLAAVRVEAEKYRWFHDLNEPRRAVVLSMIFQLGAAGFRRFSKFRQAMACADFSAASMEMLDSKWARVDSPGRALLQAGMILHGSWEGELPV